MSVKITLKNLNVSLYDWFPKQRNQSIIVIFNKKFKKFNFANKVKVRVNNIQLLLDTCADSVIFFQRKSVLIKQATTTSGNFLSQKKIVKSKLVKAKNKQDLEKKTKDLSRHIFESLPHTGKNDKKSRC